MNNQAMPTRDGRGGANKTRGSSRPPRFSKGVHGGTQSQVC